MLVPLLIGFYERGIGRYVSQEMDRKLAAIGEHQAIMTAGGSVAAKGKSMASLGLGGGGSFLGGTDCT